VLLVADPQRAVRTGLARNYAMRNVSTDVAGLTVRKALLADPDPGVRTAVQITNDHVIAHLGAIEGDLVPLAQLEPFTADPLDDPSPRVRATAVRSVSCRTRARTCARLLPRQDGGHRSSCGNNSPAIPT
jgi:hypothetical protein